MTRGSRLFFLWILMGGTPLGSAAQQETPPSSGEPSSQSAQQNERPFQPIPPADIARQSEEVATRVSQIESSLAPDPEVQDVTSELAAETQRLSADRRSAKELSQLSLRELEEVRRRWESAQSQIDGWLATLESRTTSLQSSVSELRRLGGIWAATSRATSGDVPRSVRENVEEVRAQIGRVERAAQDRLDAVLTLQSQLAEQSALVRGEMTRLDEASDAIRSSLLAPDAPPLWRAFRRGEDHEGLAQEAQVSWALTASSIGQYVASNVARFAAQGFLFLGLLWVTFQLRRHGARVGERGGQEASAQVLSHPVATALLVTMLFARVVHPLAPPGFYELNRLALLFPLLVILPGLVYSNLRTPLYVLSALYVVDQVVDFVPPQAQLSRLMQLLLAGAAFVGVLRVVRRGGPAAKLKLGAWGRAAVFVARFGALLLAVALAANLVGLLRLSSLLTDATLSSAYTAVVLFAGTLVLESLLTLLLETRSSRTLRTFRAKGEYLRAVGVRLLRLVALASWAALTLSTLQLLDPLVAGARAALAATLTLGELHVSLGDGLAFMVAIWLSFLASRVARAVLEEDVLPRFDLPRGVPGSVSKLAHYAIVLVGLIVALAAAGIELSRFALLAGAFGVGIGFGLQNIVNNFVSGLILLFERPIQVGDTIELQPLFGKVSRIGIRSSTVRTFEGAEVIVPNAHLIDSQVVNWTFSDRLRRIEVTVGVAYGSRPKAVLETLLDVARQHADILEEPEPYVLFEGFGDSSLNFVLRGWTAKFDEYLRIRSELRLGVHDALEAAGFEIPFPQRDLHVKSLPEGARHSPTSVERGQVKGEKDEPAAAAPEPPERAPVR